MKIHAFVTGAALCGASSSFADGLLFNAVTTAVNASTRTAWLTASGITTPEYLVDFESIPVGTNVHGNSSLFPGGLTISTANGLSKVTNLAADLGGSNPVDLQALSLTEDFLVTLDFATAIDYLGGFDIDQTSLDMVVTYADTTTQAFSLEGTQSGGNTAEFWGIYRNDKPGIVRVTLFGVGGSDNEWGLDNLQYGAAVPEPASLAVLGLGAVGLLRRRRAKK